MIPPPKQRYAWRSRKNHAPAAVAAKRRSNRIQVLLRRPDFFFFSGGGATGAAALGGGAGKGVIGGLVRMGAAVSPASVGAKLGRRRPPVGEGSSAIKVSEDMMPRRTPCQPKRAHPDTFRQNYRVARVEDQWRHYPRGARYREMRHLQ